MKEAVPAGESAFADLTLLEGRMAVCRLEASERVPGWAVEGDLYSISRTPDELSVVCAEENVPDEVRAERGWRLLKLQGPLDFSMTGVLAPILAPLADGGVGVFALSTYETDYVLVKDDRLGEALAALSGSDYRVRSASGDDVMVRMIREDDHGFLREMLYESVHWGAQEQGPKPEPRELLAQRSISRYVTGWGKAGDTAVVGLDGEGRRVGAAWCRIFPASDPGFGFADAATPDIAIAVCQDRRGMGVGGVLLRALMATVRAKGFGAVSLGVQKDHHAAVRLYERCGFVKVGAEGNQWIMRARLLPDTGAENSNAITGTEKP